MILVNTKDIYQAAGLKKIGPLGYPLAWMYKKIGGLSKLNDLYRRGYKKNAPDFLEYLLEDLEVTHELHEVDLNRIPKEGPFVIVSNHPLGALDGILMMHIIGKIRPDFKSWAIFYCIKSNRLNRWSLR